MCLRRAWLDLTFITGPLYVAGKRLEGAGGAEAAGFDLPIEGHYALEANRPVRLDERLLYSGQSFGLPRGAHWGTDLTRGAGDLAFGKYALSACATATFTAIFVLGF